MFGDNNTFVTKQPALFGIAMSPNATQPAVLSGHQIRQQFLDYFANLPGHNHAVKPSASLIPDNPTVMLTPAGMLPFVPIFLGIEPPPTPPRATSSQKCARVSGKASDLDNVGRTPHHHTFFEMLGNFSFGDYFKAEVIPWAWAFITAPEKEGGLAIPKEHLWVSVLGENNVPIDTESYEIWKKLGIPEERILCCGEKDNFWGPPGPTGPCGPCTEIHFDREPTGPTPKDDIALLDDAQRFTEIWNLVFMEQFQDEAGNRSELARKNIDTGMGLERIAMVLAWLADQNVTSTFDTDLFQPIIASLAKTVGTNYGKSSDTDVALKVIADHARFAVFAVADGVMPSNEGRGYILRMIIRRAFRYAKRAFDRLEGGPLAGLVSVITREYGNAYPELVKQTEKIQTIIAAEEAQFAKTLSRGLGMMDELIAQLKASQQTAIPGDQAFELYDTYGFPLELTQDIADENGLAVDTDGFEKAMAEQKERSRGARKATAIVGNQVYGEILDSVGATEFVGYETLSTEATVVALIQDGQQVEEISGTNQPFEIVLDRTPFYPEGGGQVGDRGTFNRDDGHHGLTVVINDAQKIGELIVHHGLFDNGGQLRVGERLIAEVEPDARQRAAIHHSATHLLNSALHKVLGDEGSIAQAGSQVTPESARFDFTFPRALTPTEVNRLEYVMNGWIRENIHRSVEELPIEEAKASGAISMAGETYGDTVRVVGYGGRSRELCGGTHVHALGEIGLVKILSEGSIASGVRRIELVAGERAYKAFKQQETTVLKAANLLKSPPNEVLNKVEKLQNDLKALEKQLAEAENRRLANLANDLAGSATRQGENSETMVVIQTINNTNGGGLKTLAEALSQQSASHYIVLGSNDGGKAQLAVAISKDLNSQGHKAGEVVKALAQQCGGGGGGKPTFAQAGGKLGEKVAEVIDHYQVVLA